MNYMIAKNVNFTQEMIDVCVGIHNYSTFSDPWLEKNVQMFLFQNIPGYVAEKDFSTSEYTGDIKFPSLCDVTSRDGNGRYLPPGWDDENPNWWIRKGLDTIGSSKRTEDAQSYLLYAPDEETIENLNAIEQLKDALLIEIDINDNFMKYEKNIQMPVEIASEETVKKGNENPNIATGSRVLLNNCVLPSVNSVQSSIQSGAVKDKTLPVKGVLTVQVFSAQNKEEIGLEYRILTSNGAYESIEPTIQILSCNPIPSSGNSGSTPTIDWSPKHPVTLPGFNPGDIITQSFDIFAYFEGSSYVDEILVNTIKIANCTVELDPSGGLYNDVEKKTYDISCMVGEGTQSSAPIVLEDPYSGSITNKFDNTYLFTSNPSRQSVIDRIEEDNCGLCDFSCRNIASSGCFWTYLLLGIVVLSLISIFIVLLVKYNIRKEKKQ
jgi:hypothetical protein